MQITPTQVAPRSMREGPQRPPEQVVDHWLEGVRRSPSPWFNERPAGQAISLLVVHNISLPPYCFGGGHIEALFQGRLKPDDHPYFAKVAGLQVSAHLLIRRTGELVQFVPFDKRAWHAGRSVFQGQVECNDYAIGIELEGVDDQPFTTIQYQQLAAVAKVLMQAYPQINADRMTGHSDIAPGRKTDPGPAFNWAYFRQLLAY
ncbi:1,6-anhydro-N-acetylmuramyl-L-alanine amidase AmpD [Terasakiispira papahanaumokuakeensis]|nr:1,6-anhydro-N-acetylmuramyl-L-alanine amidase AmpD [Terasakiispira papahanaumokuakeensis]